jgi:hypothetical protein
MNQLRQNTSRAKAAIALIWVVMGFEIISLISGYFQYDLLLTIEDGINVSATKIAANDIREQSIAWLMVLASIVSGITFIQWFRRAYYNLHQRCEYLMYSEGWAAGSWFVPIICLFRPLQIMRELYEQTNYYLLSKGAQLKRELTTGVLGTWWTLWILNNVLGQIVFRMSVDPDTFGQIKAASMLGMVGNILGAILCVVTVKVVKDYSEAETVLFELKEENAIFEEGYPIINE